VLDEEQHIQAAQEDGIDVEEVGSKDRCRRIALTRVPTVPDSEIAAQPDAYTGRP
jgi:hypothetical protein